MEDILKSIENEFSLGRTYQQSLEKSEKKAYGQYYTPDFVIDFILDETIAKADIVKNPFIKVLDPSCGAGFFLLKTYNILKEKFQSNIQELKETYSSDNYKIYLDDKIMEISGSKYWKLENLHYHILKHCIYGADIDEKAIWLCTAGLRAKDKGPCPKELNIIYCDSLTRWEKDYNKKQILDELEDYRLIYSIKNIKENKTNYCDRVKTEKILKRIVFWSNKYDYIIGNPPYVGHKELSMAYKKWLLKNYKEVFFDKSDLSYCFYQRAIEISANKAIIAFISSRYFIESPTGRNLRNFIKNNSKILKIVDFCGEKIFPSAGVATAIFIISIDDNKENKAEIWRYASKGLKNIRRQDFNIFHLKQKNLLDERWILVSENKREILEKIRSKSKVRLGDIVFSFQGIITGCDKAFVLDEKMAQALNIEKTLLRPWIKNSHVLKYKIEKSNYKLIYSDYIDEAKNYPNSILHIEKYKERLNRRREYKNGSRLWYQLQWGRDPKLFLKDKIVYPYKSKSNRFAIDKGGNFCSADVYSFVLKEEVSDYTLAFILGVLNSELYEFYFKLFAKKMGSGIYDYYPNTVMDLKLPDYQACKDIESLSLKLMDLYEKSEKNDHIKILEEKINSILKNYYEI